MLICKACRYVVKCCAQICPRCGSQLRDIKPDQKGDLPKPIKKE